MSEIIEESFENEGDVWLRLESTLSGLVFAIIADNQITSLEIGLIMSALEQYGIPNNHANRALVSKYLHKEMHSYSLLHSHDSEEEKKEQIQLAEEIKQEMQEEIDRKNMLSLEKQREARELLEKRSNMQAALGKHAAIVAKTLAQTIGLQEVQNKQGSFVLRMQDKSLQDNHLQR